MWSKLLITDGTKNGTVDLLPMYREWLPQLAAAKNGGYWSGSSYTQGRQLFDKQLDNVIDTFMLTPYGGSQLDTIDLINKLTTLLDKGVNYWTNEFQTEMVWLEMCPEKQLNSQYAIIMDWSIPNIDEIFMPPFSTSGGMEEISLIIEHGLWTENPPGIGTAVELQQSLIDSPYALVVDPSSAIKNVFVSNYWKDYPLDRIFVFDTPGGWTNITGLSGVDLFPAVPAIGDILYVGHTSVPFDNVIFDIATAQVDLTITPEINTGAGWVAWPVAARYSDNTVSFSVTGRNVISFIPPYAAAVWTITAVNGVNAYWIRFVVTGIGANPAPPIITTSLLTNEFPYFDVSADEVLSTYQALAHLFYRNFAGFYGISSLLIGSSAIENRDNFLAYLPAVDTIGGPGNLPNGMSFILVSAFATTATNLNIPSGSYTHWAPPAILSELVGSWQLGTTATPHYSGIYRLFLRGQETTMGANIVSNQVVINQGGVTIFESDWKMNTIINDAEVVDFGIVTIPQNLVGNYTFTRDIFINIYADTPTNASTYEYYDIILMPIDGFFGELRITPNQASSIPLIGGRSLSIDSISNPKISIDTKMFIATSDISGQLIAKWQSLAASEFFLSGNIDQRIWFLAWYDQNLITVNDPENLARFHTIAGTWLYANRKYKTLRGNI